MTQNIAVSFQNVSIVFGQAPAKALPLMDAGQNRAEIQENTGQILGVHNCSLDVEQGEILKAEIYGNTCYPGSLERDIGYWSIHNITERHIDDPQNSHRTHRGILNY